MKELRIARGLSQERLALNAGITPAYLGLVEREKRNATVAIIERICMAMNVSLAEFFAVDTAVADSIDATSQQILFEISGLKETEKQLVLQIVKNAIELQKMGAQKKEEVCC